MTSQGPRPGAARRALHCASAAEVARRLSGVDPGRLDRARREADERPIAYPLGSGQAEELAVFAGLKPLLRQVLVPEELAGARRRFETMGLLSVDLPTPPPGPAGTHVIFAGQDRARIDDAVAHEVRTMEDAELGALLGYPACCAASFAQTPQPRLNTTAFARAAGLAGPAAAARLNVLDLGVFHYLPWLPCSFACAPSLAFADALASIIRAWSGAFVRGRGGALPERTCPPGCQHDRFVDAIDAALGRPRLLVLEDVQITLEGTVEGDTVHVSRAWPTARDRHPRARLDPTAREAAARLAAAVDEACAIRTEGGVLYRDGRPLLASDAALLVPFGPRM